MSTKVTLTHSKDYHLYEECFDKNLVYLQLDDPVCLQVDMWEASKGKVTVAVPIDTWRHIVEGWLKTQWAQNPDWDNDNEEEYIPLRSLYEQVISRINKLDDDTREAKGHLNILVLDRFLADITKLVGE